MSFPAELPFATALVYSKHGPSPTAAKSRRVRDALGRGDPKVISAAVARLAGWFDRAEFELFFGADVILVPAPGSAVLPKGPAARAIRTPRDLCLAIRDAGHGAEVREALRRTQTVPKSAFAMPGQRPTLQRHWETMACEARLFAGWITIVDDFVTKGRTLLAAAARIKVAMPGADVRPFALVRTMNFAADIDRVVWPCVGLIRHVADDASRDP